jgi:hypothetical protein
MKKTLILILLVFTAFPVIAAEISGFGLNAGVGTDVSLGLAAGVGISYLMVNDPELSLEAGFNLYFSSYKESSVDGPADYVYYDSATTIIFAVAANALFNYNPKTAGIYTLAGLGAGGVNINWEKSSTDDPTYNDSGDSTGGSLIINLGVGGTFGNGFELRAQLPVFMTFTGLGTIFSPALTIGAGLRL